MLAFPSRTGSRLLLCAAVVAASAACAPAQAPDKKKVPDPVDIELKDKVGALLSVDGVQLKGTYWAGTKGKDSVPIILLHSWKGSRTEFGTLGTYLQSQGHAVLAIDLRAHGESTAVAGVKKLLDTSAFPPLQYERMVKDDVEACKRFFMDKNNAGECNIDKLCIVGNEMGAIVALNYASWDWHWPPLATGKQGQDVKAVVLISPGWTVEKGSLNMGEPSQNAPMQNGVAVYVIWGKKNKANARDAKRLYDAIERFHDVDEKSPKKNLYKFEADTTLQGAKLFTVPALEMEKRIGAFIDLCVGTKTFTWRDRSGPLN